MLYLLPGLCQGQAVTQAAPATGGCSWRGSRLSAVQLNSTNHWTEAQISPALSYSSRWPRASHEVPGVVFPLLLAHRAGVCRGFRLSVTDIWGFPSECLHCSVLHLYISYSSDMEEEVKIFEAQVVPELRILVENDGHYLNIVRFPKDCQLDVSYLPMGGSWRWR